MKPCSAALPGDWEAAGQGDQIFVIPTDLNPFCVRIIARDEHGAEGAFQDQLAAANQTPTADLQIEASAAADGGVYPLYTKFRLAGERSMDPDRDHLTFHWTVSGANVGPVTTTACGTTERPENAACFQATSADAYTALLEVRDEHGKEGSAGKTLTVATDQPACLAVTDPDITLPYVPLRSDETRTFEIRRVNDDGHAFPPGPAGVPLFYWFKRGKAGWERDVFNNGPTYAVSAALFEDPRPGSRLHVRVEVRDPLHNDPQTVAQLRSLCGDRPSCEHPTSCIRWVSWEVVLQ